MPTRIVTTMMAALGCAVANHTTQTDSTSSPKLRAQLLRGSGLRFTAARALALVPWDVSAMPPASRAAPQRQTSGAAAVAPKARRADECMDRLPDGINVRDLVRQKLQQIENNRDPQNRGMGEDAEVFWQLN